MKSKQNHGLASTRCWATIKLTAGTMAMLAVCALTMSLAACGSKDDADDEYGEAGMKAEIKAIYGKGEQASDYRFVHKGDYLWYTFEVAGAGNPTDYKYHFSQNHVEISFGHKNSEFDYRIWLFTEDNYKAYQKTKNYKIERAAYVPKNGVDVLPNKKYYLRILPQWAGKFDLKMSCIRKEVNGSNATTIDMPVCFHAVEVEGMYDKVYDAAKKYLRHEFFFKINSGNWPGDNLLIPKSGNTITWQVDYAGGHYKGKVEKNGYIKFYGRKEPNNDLIYERQKIDAITLFIDGPEIKHGMIKFTNVYMSRNPF